jgi:hypothetical protein
MAGSIPILAGASCEKCFCGCLRRYMIITSLVHGLDSSAAYQPPGSLEDVFAAVSNILFTFGGHCMLLEVLDSQFK